MAATPNTTLTATLQDFSGNPVSGGFLIIKLCGYGQVLPRIVGTSIIARIDPPPMFLQGGISAGVPLWGNDQITPAGTYYAIALMDDKKQILQSGIYQFNDAGLIDLSNAPQLPEPPTILGSGYHSEALSGAIDGVNTQFGFSAPLDQSQLFMLFYNGVYMRPGLDYSVQNGMTQMLIAPQDGDWLWGVYISKGQPLPFSLPCISIAPVGQINGANQSFALPSAPSIPQMLFQYVNGIFQRPGVDAFLEGTNVVLVNPPQAGDWLWTVFPA